MLILAKTKMFLMELLTSKIRSSEKNLQNESSLSHSWGLSQLKYSNLSFSAYKNQEF